MESVWVEPLVLANSRTSTAEAIAGTDVVGEEAAKPLKVIIFPATLNPV
ncbi:hypothetical protein ASZ90_008562 [hydrocarbon metagenome]|uniref:Uncharacterized protein n=1 Tax=hydrocarbon metagenome TaxID=938273 RepID=A0A0W8FLU0_9ZZZZ